MGTKGTKASNIYQVLKGSGAWQSKDSQGPMIKGVGIKSPLNMKKASPAKAADDSIMKPPSNDKPKSTKKVSYKDAYKKRDMKTYVNYQKLSTRQKLKGKTKVIKKLVSGTLLKNQWKLKVNQKK